MTQICVTVRPLALPDGPRGTMARLRGSGHYARRPRRWWMAVDRVLASHHPRGQWWHAPVRGPADRWPWSRAERQEAWTRTLDVAAGPLPERGRWHAGARMLRTDRQQFES